MRKEGVFLLILLVVGLFSVSFVVAEEGEENFDCAGNCKNVCETEDCVSKCVIDCKEKGDSEGDIYEGCGR